LSLDEGAEVAVLLIPDWCLEGEQFLSDLAAARERICQSALRSCILSHAESFGVAIKQQPFPREQRNLQETPVTI